jgi:Cell wall-active antibiotics response 4TMS YvqF
MTTAQTPVAQPEAQPGPPRRGLEPARIVLGLLLTGWGLAWLLDASGVLEVRVGVLLAGTLVAIGLMLMLAADRRSHGGLIVLGIALTVILAASATTAGLDVNPGAGVGDRVVRPVTAAELATTHRLDAGNLTVDLRDAVLAETGTTTVAARVGVGQLVVRVPAGVVLEVHGQAGIGEVRVLGHTEHGIDVDTTQRDGVELTEGSHKFRLDLRVGIGGIEVEQ